MLAHDGLEQEFKLFNRLEDSLCTASMLPVRPGRSIARQASVSIGIPSLLPDSAAPSCRAKLAM